MNELRPKLFDVMKGYTKTQLLKDIISGIIVAIIALPLSIALAIASGVGPEQGLYTAIIAGFLFHFGGIRVQIGGPTSCFCRYHLWDRRTIWNRRTYSCNNTGRNNSCHHGNMPFRLTYQIYPIHDNNRFYLWYSSYTFVGQLKDFFGLSIKSVPSEFLDKVIVYAKNIKSVNITLHSSDFQP